MGKVNRASPAFIRRAGDAKRALDGVAKNIEAALAGAAKEAVKQVTDDILKLSQERVPVDTGALKRSGFTDVEVKANEVVGQVGYSKNGSVPYAVFVHEIIQNQHPNGQAKFLQSAAQEKAGALGDAVAKEIKKVVR